MVKSLKEWISLLCDNNLLCDAYKNKFERSHTKSSIMNLCLDANGISFLCEMSYKGYELPYDVIKREFGRYINGAYVSSHVNEVSHVSYTGSIYCCYKDDIHVNTTCVSLLGCECDVYVDEYDYVRIYIDKNSIIRVHCPKSATCQIVTYGGVSEDVNKFSNVVITKND